MTRFQYSISCVFLVLCMVFSFTGCGEKEKGDEDLLIGNWTQYRNRAYILLVISSTGSWNSSVRIADATSKIVKSKGDAQGTWHIEGGQLIFTVMDSTIEEIWEKNATSFFEIVELGERIMLLKEESGRIAEWKKTQPQRSGKDEAETSVTISMKPITVNLNKDRSTDPNRYLCLKMKMVLRELMPDQSIPVMHPKALESAIIFLSSLVYEDVKDFDQVKIQRLKLVDVLNPYMEGFIKDIEIEHVIIATTIEKVEEFIIEHTIGLKKEGKAETGEKTDGEKSSGDKKEGDKKEGDKK